MAMVVVVVVVVVLDGPKAWHRGNGWSRVLKWLVAECLHAGGGV